jgi:DNA-binding beta-propeller fold protein YncE
VVEPAAVFDLTVTLADMPTVLEVRWRTDVPALATVIGRFAGGEVRVEEIEAVTDHAALLVGIPALTEVAVEVLPADGGEAGTATVVTGSLPSWVPDVTTEADAPQAAEGGFTVVSAIGLLEGSGPVVFDGAGRPVWAVTRLLAGDSGVTRARLSRDERAIVYLNMAPSADGDAQIVRVPLDGGELLVTLVRGIHTDFVELPSGGLAALGWDVRTYGDRTIVGDTIVELGPDGEARVVWSAYDTFAPDLDEDYPNWYPGDPLAEDWTHVNGIAYDADSDDYYVTMTWRSRVLRVDRGTGAVVWDLSDDGGSFARVGSRYLLDQPHSVQPTATGVLVFNREDPIDPESCSGATDITLNEAAFTAEATWVYTSEACLLTTFLGSAQRLPGGNTLVAFTNSGQLDEVTPAGELAWRVSAPIGTGFGFAERVPRLGDGFP